MPKLKSNKGAAKRFRPTSAGRFKHKQSHLRHILTKKASKRKRKLGKKAVASPANLRAIKAMLPYDM